MQSTISWQQWKRKYSKEIQHIAGFEEKFVDTVLAKIAEITPNDVIPQYHFIDSNGRNRYVDFMIINSDKNYCLPIELDGYSKMVGNPNDITSHGENYKTFNDFLERQNSMIIRFGLVMRYTNKTMLNDPDIIIKELKQTLKNQKEEKSIQETKDRHTKKIIADYEKKIQELSKKNIHKEEELKSNNVLKVLLSEINDPVENKKENKNKRKFTNTFSKIIPRFFIILAIPILIIYFLELSKNNTYLIIKDMMYILTNKESNSSTTEYVIGKRQEVCGTVAQVKSLGDRSYLNIGKPYPNQDISITVWLYDDLSSYEGKKVCTTGKVTEYKGKPQISVNSLKGLYKM